VEALLGLFLVGVFKEVYTYITSKPNIEDFFFILLTSCSHFPPLSISILCLISLLVYPELRVIP